MTTNCIAMCEWVFEHARRTPDAPAVDSPDDRLSYRVLARRASACGNALLRMGVQPGDTVLVALPNVPAAVVVSLAVQHIGAVSVEVSREWTEEQLAIALAETHARTVVIAGRDAKRLGALLRSANVRGVVVALRGEMPPQMHESLRGLSTSVMSDAGALPGSEEDAESLAPPVNHDPDRVTLLLYTSGSTGLPRAVLQTSRNVATNARSIADYLALGAQDRAMLILPLSYCYGRSVLQTHLMVGGSVFLDRRFMYPRVVLDAIGTEHCTGFAGVPLTFELLRRNARPEPASMPSLRYVTQAGGAMRPDTIDWARAAFEPAKLFVMYGQTEATARLAYLPPDRAADKRGSIGVAIPNVELRVVDELARELPRGTTGHLVARGPNVTPGYLDAPEETATILRDGWLWTGDLAERDDDGFFFVVGRAKEILKIAGYRVAPAQIESVLLTHAAVEEVAVAGIADPLTGEASAALVVLRSGMQVTLEDLRRFCLGRLAPPLVPRRVRFTEAMPRNASGKVMREEVARVLRSLEGSEKASS